MVPRPSAGRLKIAGLFALFFTPVLIAWLLNLQSSGWLPFGTTNHGRLVDPPLHLEGLAESAHPSDGGWVLLSLTASDCGYPCRVSLDKTLRARLALGKDMDRVRRVLVMIGAVPPDVRRRLRIDGADLELIAISTALLWGVSLDRLPGNAPGPNSEGSVSEGSVYLVDPQGYLILHYPGDASATDINKDLKRLLRISKIG